MLTKTIKAMVAGAFSACVWMAPANAAYIYNSGPGANQQGGTSVNTAQYVAVEVALDGPATIGSIEAWLAVFNPGSLTISLHGSSGLTPGAQLHSKAVTLSTTTTADWYGVSGLDWTVDAGTYWISLIPDAVLSAALPTSPVGTDEVAIGGSGYGGGWFVPSKDYWDNENYAIRIGAAEEVAVAEPAMLGLVGVGVLGLAWRRRRTSAA